MSFAHYDSAIMHNLCLSTNCRQLAHVLRGHGEDRRPSMCGAQEVLETIQSRDGNPERLRALREALTVCSEACRERLAACEAKNLGGLRKWNAEVLQRASRVREEVRRLT